jgi:hypothetical protein
MYKKGESGNPGGKPRALGVPNYIPFLQKKYEPIALELYYRKSIELAQKEGASIADLDGIRTIYNGTNRKRAACVPINLVGTLQEQINSIKQATTEGRLTPQEVFSLMNAVAQEAKVIETTVLMKEIEDIKEKMESNTIISTSEPIIDDVVSESICAGLSN